MLRLRRTLRLTVATLLLAAATGCSYDSPLTDLECENEGEIDGDRICQEGIWVERSSGPDIIDQDAGEDADQDVMPPQDTGDADPPEDTSDTSTGDAEDTTTQDATDTTVEDAQDTTVDDVSDTNVDDATDTTPNDASDTVDPDTGDAGDTVDPDTGDTGTPCVTPLTVTNNPALGYWSLDAPNASGEYPHSGSAPFGPAVPSTATAANPLNVSGRTGNAVEMDGDGDYLKIDHHSEMLLAKGTVSFWVNIHNFNSIQGLWSKDASGNPDGGHLNLEVRGDNRLYARLQSDSASYEIQSGALQANQWIHVALVFGPTNTGRSGLELYINGSSVASNAYAGGLDSVIRGEKATNEEPIGLGVTTTSWNSSNPSAWPGSNEQLDGMLDEVALFDQRLTPQEIQSLAQNSCP